MTRWVALLPAEGSTAYDRADAAAGVLASSAGPELPGSFGGRGASWDLTSERPPAQVAAGLGLPGPLDAVALTPVRARTVPSPGPRVKRTLLLAVRPGTPEERVARLEADLLAMPAHIATIRSWALSRVDQGRTPGRWTHVWEQEFADVAGLAGEYLGHPYHWTYVDRWFDGEVPGGGIVEPPVAHLFRWSGRAVLVGR
ncbi:Dabb family protein [Streptomyces sp. B-S-A8]|uniref:Dabb family protein n=1 Tax=Streptomyces solicavernae TaxID=3043614 RepID=A0ABT6RSW9_9ACTN|nr:Dabb family protein [Streptomyces sp. B-S-A8]MDI3387524.1 Dabb family protein [Streptomyces sp. B-S-A8]